MAKKQKNNMLEWEMSFGGVTLTQKAVFAKHLAVMLKSGLLVDEALEIAAESAKGKLKRVLLDVSKSVNSGTSLSDSFAKHPRVFAGLFIEVTRAGEAGGTLPENLENIALQLEKEKTIVTKVKGAMIYPIVVLIATMLLGLGMAYFILPQITPLFSGLKVDLPLSTRMVIAFSDLVQNYGGWLIIGFLFSVIVLVWLVRQRFMRPITHWLLLHVPIVRNISKNNNLVRFSLTLGTLLKSGLTIDEAMSITKETVSNHYFQQALSLVESKVSQGGKMSDRLIENKKLFPRLVTSMIHVGEESGSLDETLLYLADFYETEVDTSTKALTTALEPLLLIVIGLAVGTLALSIITPIYEITGNISR